MFTIFHHLLICLFNIQHDILKGFFESSPWTTRFEQWIFIKVLWIQQFCCSDGSGRLLDRKPFVSILLSIYLVQISFFVLDVNILLPDCSWLLNCVRVCFNVVKSFLSWPIYSISCTRVKFSPIQFW